MPKSKKVERPMGLFDICRVDKIVRISKVISENTLDKSKQAWSNKHNPLCHRAKRSRECN